MAKCNTQREQGAVIVWTRLKCVTAALKMINPGSVTPQPTNHIMRDVHTFIISEKCKDLQAH